MKYAIFFSLLGFSVFLVLTLMSLMVTPRDTLIADMKDTIQKLEEENRQLIQQHNQSAEKKSIPSFQVEPFTETLACLKNLHDIVPNKSIIEIEWLFETFKKLSAYVYKCSLFDSAGNSLAPELEQTLQKIVVFMEFKWPIRGKEKEKYCHQPLQDLKQGLDNIFNTPSEVIIALIPLMSSLQKIVSTSVSCSHSNEKNLVIAIQKQAVAIMKKMS